MITWLFSLVSRLTGLNVRPQKSKREEGRAFAQAHLDTATDKAKAHEELEAWATNPFDFDDFERGILDVLQGRPEPSNVPC